MSYPDTTAQAADRVLARIRRGADVLVTEANQLTGPLLEERRKFLLIAIAGASRYVEILTAEIAEGPVTMDLVQRAEVVATATECSGWLGAGGYDGSHRAAMRHLIGQGVFDFYPAVPGKWLACYRLGVWSD